MPADQPIPTATDDSRTRCICEHHGIIEELRQYVYENVPQLLTRVGKIWATIATVTLCGGVIVTLLMTEVGATRSQVREEQTTHKSDTAEQLTEMKDLVKSIAKSTKVQELSALATEKNVAVFMERYSVIQEQNRRDIEELSRRTERNHEELEALKRAQGMHPGFPKEEE